MREQIDRLENEKLLLLDKFELFKRTADTTKKQDSINMPSVVAPTSIELMSTIVLVMLKRYNVENEAWHFRTRLFFPTAERLNDSYSTTAWRRCSPLKSSHETDLLRFDPARSKTTVPKKYAGWSIFAERKQVANQQVRSKRGDPWWEEILEENTLNLIRQGSRKFFRMVLDRSDRWNYPYYPSEVTALMTHPAIETTTDMEN